MDDQAESVLVKLKLHSTVIIPLSKVESVWPILQSIKTTRSRAEYCWTLTPFAPEMVFILEPEAKRATYLDADLYFFGPASKLLNEMDSHYADAMITDHAYAPEYTQESTSGRYCVQFMPFRNTTVGIEILRWWQTKCIEWCYARFEDGKFGDQKYVESWPTKWPSSVHILKETTLTLAPWNAKHLLRKCGKPLGIYHFHGLRVFDKSIRLWSGYQMLKAHRKSIYDIYLQSILAAISKIKSTGVDVNFISAPPRKFFSKEKIKHFILRTEAWIRYSPSR